MGQKPCGGGVKAERWGSRDGNHGDSFRKDSCEHKSREVHGQLGRQYVLRWWGCLFIFTGPEKRADVQREAERREEGMMAEPETWGDGTGDPNTNRRLAIKRGTLGTTSSEKGQWNMIFYGGCGVRTPLPELEGQASGENVKLSEEYCFWKISFQLSLLSRPAPFTEPVEMPAWVLESCVRNHTSNFRIVVWMTGLIVSFGNLIEP